LRAVIDPEASSAGFCFYAVLEIGRVIQELYWTITLEKIQTSRAECRFRGCLFEMMMY